MAEKQILLQVTFDKGIVENAAQDAVFEAGQPPVHLLWCENYVPSIRYGMLVKRKGQHLKRNPANKASIPEYTVQFDRPQAVLGTGIVYSPPSDSILITYKNDDFSDDLTDDQSAGATHKGILAGVTSFYYNLPTSQEIIVCFLKNIQDNDILPYITQQTDTTLVVSYCVEHGDNNRKWRNAHINSPLGSIGTDLVKDPLVYRGWWARGYMSDYTRHGGNIIFSTTLDDNTLYTDNTKYGEMYPVYVWTYWDITKKRNDDEYFFSTAPSAGAPRNGTVALSDLTPSYSVDNKYSHFKILNPALHYTRNNYCHFRCLPVPSTVPPAEAIAYLMPLYNPYVHFNALVGTAYDPQAPIEILIKETPTREYKIAGGAPGSITTDEGSYCDDLKYPLLWEAKWYNKDTQWVESLETIKMDSIYTDMYHTPLWTGKMMGGQLDFNESWIKGQRQLRWRNQDIDTDIVYLKGGTSVSASDEDWALSNPEYYDSRNEDTKRRHTLVYGTRLPNYIENGTPRSWIKGERVPLIITAIVNGGEVVIGSYCYEVQGQNMEMPFPNLFNPFFHSEYSDEWHHRGSSTEWWSKSSRYTLYAATKSSDMTLDNQVITPSTVMHSIGYTETQTIFGLIPSQYINMMQHWVAYCYEPYNPTIGLPFRRQDPQNLTDPDLDKYFNYWYNPGSPDSTGKWGYLPKHNVGNYIDIKLRIQLSQLRLILDGNISKINIYVAKASTDKSILRSVGLWSYTKNVPPTLYGEPATLDLEDYTKYGLWKSFVIDGETESFADWNDYNEWKNRYRGQPTESNAWTTIGSSDANRTIVSAVREKKTGGGVVTPSDTEGPFPTNVLWDYAVEGKTLTLNSSGKYWQGKGASCVTTIKGMPFIGGCIDKYGEAEQGIIRYTDIQSGFITYDVFSEEKKLKLGGLPHVALVEFREQLWAFSRQELHRVQIVNVADPANWEILEKIAGQGTYEPKTVCVCPLGVVWCNDRGVWISDGSPPQNIAEPILGFYKKMALNVPYKYEQAIDIGEFAAYDTGYNVYMEIIYDQFNDSIVISSPVFKQTNAIDGTIYMDSEKELRLIFNFGTKSWHAEGIELPDFDTAATMFQNP